MFMSKDELSDDEEMGGEFVGNSARPLVIILHGRPSFPLGRPSCFHLFAADMVALDICLLDICLVI